jgi:diguanylate cyclase (GGDEF)-like protein/PAS domain S-box-containing protein
VTRAALELKKITNSIRAGLAHFVLEDNCRIIYASKGFYEILGYNKNTAEIENKNSLMDYMDTDYAGFLDDVRSQLGNETIRTEVKLITQSGNQLYMLMNGNSTVGKDGKHKLSVVFVDISEQKRMQDINLLEAERYRIATELSNDVLFEYHIQSDEMIHTGKFKELFGRNPVMRRFIYTLEEHIDYVHPDDWGIFLEYGQELLEGKSIIEVQFRIKNKLGDYIWCQVMGKTIYDDKKLPIRVIGKIVNVDAQKRELEALEYKATRDPLTGVYNKEVTLKKIDKYISGNKNGTHLFMLVDFDNYKSINDQYGHLRGDKVLVFMINRIKDTFTEGEIIGRIGGDEFIVFAGNINSMDEAASKAKSLKQALDNTYNSDTYSIPISGSIGVSMYPKDGLNYEQLMERADTALYSVKKQGKNNYLFYSSTT